MSHSQTIRILCVDNHPLLRMGIAAIIESQPDMVFAAEATNGRDAIEKFTKLQPDVTLMDLRFPDMNGVDSLIAIRASFPDARIIILTSFDGDIDIQRALVAGARGYLLKGMPPQEILDAIRQVHTGGKSIPSMIATRLAEHLSDEALTHREIEILRCVADGNRNREIAERLFITVETVKVHIRHVMEKLGAADRTQAMAIAVRRGIIQV